MEIKIVFWTNHSLYIKLEKTNKKHSTDQPEGGTARLVYVLLGDFTLQHQTL